MYWWVVVEIPISWEKVKRGVKTDCTGCCVHVLPGRVGEDLKLDTLSYLGRKSLDRRYDFAIRSRGLRSAGSWLLRSCLATNECMMAAPRHRHLVLEIPEVVHWVITIKQALTQGSRAESVEVGGASATTLRTTPRQKVTTWWASGLHAKMTAPGIQGGLATR
jgi:hypothetical protein